MSGGQPAWGGSRIQAGGGELGAGRRLWVWSGATWGSTGPTVVGRLIYSHVNIRERNSDTFPVKNNQVHFWALRGVVKTLLSTIMCEAENL